MKNLSLLCILFVVAAAKLPANDNDAIPLKVIREIADRNAQSLWGEVYPATPIPYYGTDDEIIAWRFNYAIGKPFPDTEFLHNTCRQFEESGNTYLQWGGDDFGQLLLAARSKLPVIIEYSQSLSGEYAMGHTINIINKNEGKDHSVKTGKIYYLSHFQTWHEFKQDDEYFYVCTSPLGGLIDEATFIDKKNSARPFIKPADFSKQWNQYKKGKTLSSKSDVYINNPELMPFYDWSYGCSPTAATMLFAWYDNRSLISSNKYSYLITHHFMRYDTLKIDGYYCHMDYNVPWLQKMLALGMDTDTLTGRTTSSDIDDGMIWAANTLLDYDFDVKNRYTSKWLRLRNDIDAGKPLLAHIEEHSTTAIGYNYNNEKIITHYTHSPPDHLVWIDKSALQMITRVTHGGQRGAAVKLRKPNGDPRYSNDGEGEVYSAGNYAEIIWLADDVPGSTINLSYSLDGGYNFQTLGEGLPNNGMYDWLIPEDTESAECRIMANIYTPEMGIQSAGADGSWGNFIIHDDEGAIPLMEDMQIYEAEKTTRYYHFVHDHDSWAVIGNYSTQIDSNYEIQLFEDPAFNSDPMLTSVYFGWENFIVIDGNHAANAMMGVKLRPAGNVSPNFIQYEGDDETLTLTSGAKVDIGWNNNQLVKMYDVHLTPGRYYFKATRTEGNVDVDIAFFSSNDGNYYKRIIDADYLSDNHGGVEDSFVVTITEEDDYGFVLYAKGRGNGNIQLSVEDAFIWTGAVDNNWHNAENWLAGLIPDGGSKVVIPVSENPPIVSTSDAMCNTLHVLPETTLRINNNNVFVGERFLNEGGLNIFNPDSRLFCAGDVEMGKHANMNLDDGAKLQVEGNWTFEKGCLMQDGQGMVEFTGSSNAIIYVKSENAAFHDLRISKTGGAWVAYDNCIDMQALKVKGQFIVDDGASFIQWAMHNTIFEGPFLAYPGSHFAFNNGTTFFHATGSGGIAIHSEPGNYFNHVTVNVEDWLGLLSDIEIRGDLVITGGTFRTQGHDVYLGGHFTQNAGFNHGNSTVIFNGNGTQNVNGINFWRVVLDKYAGELRFPENQTNIQHYDWTKGSVRVNGGEVFIWDLDDPGMYGDIYVTSGRLDIRQDPGSFVDLNGNLFISGGVMNILGGNDDCYFAYENEASITMSDGVLDFKDMGVRILNVGHPFSENISGGSFRTRKSMDIQRTDFNPTGGTFEFYGGTDDAALWINSNSHLYDLMISKSTDSKDKGLVKTLAAYGTINVKGDFILESGRFEAPPVMNLSGSFINNKSPANFVELTGNVVMDGDYETHLTKDETFYKLTINKSATGSFVIDEDVIASVTEKLMVDQGTLQFNQGSTLLVGSAFESDYGGWVRFAGEESGQVLVSSLSKTNYSFLTSGGAIEAKHTIFENMDADGINIGSGTYVPHEMAFHHCTFRDGAPGGTLITWDQGATITVEQATFPENTGGCLYNVTKNSDNGNVFFEAATGPFSGEDFENDLYNRVHWEYVPPYNLPFLENWNTEDYATNRWLTIDDNWMFSDIDGNPAPSAKFNFFPRLYDYSSQLRSHYLDASDYINVFLSYDLAYDDYQYMQAFNQLEVRVVLNNDDFITLATYNSIAGSFDFISEEYNISAIAAGNEIRIVFVASGNDTWGMNGWLIDNVSVHGNMPAPAKLIGYVHEQSKDEAIEHALVAIEGTEYQTYTLPDGSFSISDIFPGIYDIHVSAENFYPLFIEDIFFKAGETIDMSFDLQPFPPAYCTENLYTTGCETGYGLDLFALHDLFNDDSGCSDDGYGDFTAMSTDLARGYPYPVGFRSISSGQYVSVWIDFNDDYEFDESERIVTDYYLEEASQLYESVIYIPPGAPLGQHRLRVRTNLGAPASDPCESYEFGETEDYTVNITDEVLYGQLLVTLVDNATGDPVPEATVVLLESDSYGYTEEEGVCFIDFITPGFYDVNISAGGYNTLLLHDIFIAAGQLQNIEESLVSASFTCGDLLLDNRDGKLYKTVLIGSQCWMAENLNIGELVCGDYGDDQLNNGVIEKYCYNNSSNWCDLYGGLYQWDEMMQYTTTPGVQGICPDGWHIPTIEEWLELPVVEGNKLKDCRQINSPLGGDCDTEEHPRWLANPINFGTDEYGFSALPGGDRYYNGGFYNVGFAASWWTSTVKTIYAAWVMSLTYHQDQIASGANNKPQGYSVRCVKDAAEEASLPTVITSELTAITANSAVAGGTVVDDGGAAVTARGVVWSTNENPTVELNAGMTDDGEGTGEFVSFLSGLDPQTTYHVRAYAVNIQGTAYGQNIQFTTDILDDLYLSDLTLDDVICFSAAEKIIVAGDGSQFVVESGASVELVAGQVIFLKHGTIIKQGAGFLARITADGTYCNNAENILAAQMIDDHSLPTTTSDFINNTAPCNLYPNPVKDKLVIECPGVDKDAIIAVHVFDLQGELVYKHTISGLNEYTIDFFDKKPGIYVVRIIMESSVITEKILKQ